ncbi:MAG: hypothetical protein ACRD8O_18940, partial [Bryobacteraceae bacterium]
LRHVATSPDGRWMAAAASQSISLIPAEGGEPRVVAFDGPTELEWGRDLFAGRGAELWRISIDGSRPVQITSPGNRSAGFSLHPDGEQIAVTAGDAKSEVWVLPVR